MHKPCPLLFAVMCGILLYSVNILYYLLIRGLLGRRTRTNVYFLYMPHLYFFSFIGIFLIFSMGNRHRRWRRRPTSKFIPIILVNEKRRWNIFTEWIDIFLKKKNRSDRITNQEYCFFLKPFKKKRKEKCRKRERN